MRPDQPGFEDIRQAFAATRLEPEVSDAILEAYAAGRATEAEREIVETMMEVDPGIAETVAIFREELVRVGAPLPIAVPPPEPKPKVGFWARWRIPASAGFALVAGCLLVVVFLDRSRLSHDSGALAMAHRDSDTLRQEIVDLQNRLGSAGSDRKRLEDALRQAQTALVRQTASAAPPSSGVASIVAGALTQGLRIPSFLADIAVTRGEIQLALRMTPDKTALRMPVRLAWSVAGTTPGVEFQVEVSSMGISVWRGRVAKPQAELPAGVLKAGQTYSWRVAQGIKVSDWSSFRVCTPAETRQADAISGNREYGPLERGILYAQMGLESDARTEFDKLHQAEPALADKLIHELDQASK